MVTRMPAAFVMAGSLYLIAEKMRVLARHSHWRLTVSDVCRTHPEGMRLARRMRYSGGRKARRARVRLTAICRAEFKKRQAAGSAELAMRTARGWELSDGKEEHRG